MIKLLVKIMFKTVSVLRVKLVLLVTFSANNCIIGIFYTNGPVIQNISLYRYIDPKIHLCDEI